MDILYSLSMTQLGSHGEFPPPTEEEEEEDCNMTCTELVLQFSLKPISLLHNSTKSSVSNNKWNIYEHDSLANLARLGKAK